MVRDSDEYNSCWDDEKEDFRGWSKNINAPAGVHIMNKNESAVLRKLKKETGLNEEELRKEKKYRKILSEAQKEKGKKDEFDRFVIARVRSVTRETKLPIQHPEFKEKLKEELHKRSRCNYFYTISPDKIISHYLSLRKKSKEKIKKKN